MEKAHTGPRPGGMRAGLRRTLDRWIRNRGGANPPLTIGYRQIFILPTRFGWLLGLLMFGMLMGSLNFNNNLGLLTTFIVAGLGLNAMLLAYRNLRGLQVRRCTGAPVFAGQVARLHMTFVNPDARPRPALELVFDRHLQSFDIPATDTGEVEVPVTTSRRGWLTLGRMRLQTSHPIGLFESWSWFWPEQALLVWPRPAKRPPPLPRGGGDTPGPRQARQLEGENFYSLRDWRSGDPLHRIAWKASQRHQTLLSREFRAEQAEHLELDLNHTPGRNLEERIANLAAWVLQAEREGLSWTLSLPGSVHGPDGGTRHSHRCLRALAEL